MSNKSYKRNQNRLYREIKRRIIAEHKSLSYIKFSTVDLDIITLKVKKIFPRTLIEDAWTFIEEDMAKQIAIKLLNEGYIKYKNEIEQEDITVVEAKLDIVKKPEFM